MKRKEGNEIYKQEPHCLSRGSCVMAQVLQCDSKGYFRFLSFLNLFHLESGFLIVSFLGDMHCQRISMISCSILSSVQLFENGEHYLQFLLQGYRFEHIHKTYLTIYII